VTFDFPSENTRRAPLGVSDCPSNARIAPAASGSLLNVIIFSISAKSGVWCGSSFCRSWVGKRLGS